MFSWNGKIKFPDSKISYFKAYRTLPCLIGYYVRRDSILPRLDAIRKMTLLPIKAMKLEKQGILKPGSDVDLVIFNFDKIKNTATFKNAREYL